MSQKDTHIGSTVGDRFRISRLVGEDSAGRRYVARDRETRKQVRVLLVHPSVMDHHAEAFRRTSAALLGLRHPNTVRLLAHGEIHGHGYRVSEWSRGHTLLEVLEEGKPLLSSTVAWMKDLAEALDEAHEIGFLHRGIDPSTIHLVRRSEPPDQALLHDWGLAPLLEGGDPGSSTGLMAVGGAAWLAPEHIQGEPCDARTDLYSLGAVLFQCVVGTPPYTGPSMKVLAAHVNEPVPAPSQRTSGIPHWLDDLVIGLLSKDPAERPQTAAEVVTRLEEGAALLHDGAAHPERITATVPPVRLPKVEIRGAGSTRLPEVVADPRGIPPPTFPLAALAAFGLFLVGALALSAMILILLLGPIR